MIRRPLDARFHDAVLAGRKITTIRRNGWPVGVPIMLYNWRGAAYRSKQMDVAAVMVRAVRPITIEHDAVMGMRYSIHAVNQLALWSTEGFAARVEMDAWFRLIVREGEAVTQFLMEFERMKHAASMVASCDCLTKTPEVKYHKPGCRYRVIAELNA